MTHSAEPDWLRTNRANWDQRVDHHLEAWSYDLAPLRAGRGKLNPIEEAELGDVDGQRVLHLQCHFGRDSLILAQRGARVTGLDFSPRAIAVARGLAAELGLDHRARFIEAALADAPSAVPEPVSFDRVYVTWGALCWLPDIEEWAGIVAYFLAPGGRLYLADHHPTSYVFDDDAEGRHGALPGWFWPYFERAPLVEAKPVDYAGGQTLTGGPSTEWAHPLGTIVTALISAGLRLDWLHEHDAVPWGMFGCLELGADGLHRWPDRPWLPLSFSLQATRA
ncbi:MAG: class I SAM-dependent methyltransferase [Pseudomonadota bacterium]